jgi:uncharacterized protein (TIGR02757 family)
MLYYEVTKAVKSKKKDKKLDLKRQALEALYKKYDARKWVHPDPLEFLYKYKALADREIVALIASSLAYGRVAQILKSVERILVLLGPSPSDFIFNHSGRDLSEMFHDFRHRFTRGEDMTAMLLGAKKTIETYGSLQKCLLRGLGPGDETIIPALSFLMKELASCCAEGCNSLMPIPERGSACKRLNLFMRWMVRKDNVDPGGWDEIPPSILVVPLDTHMHRICGRLGLSARKSADANTALEITRAFREIAPSDPVRYDFALTRLGIRQDSDPEASLEQLENKGQPGKSPEKR